MKQCAKWSKLPPAKPMQVMCDNGGPQPLQQCVGIGEKGISEFAGSSGEGRQHKYECDEDFQMPKRKFQCQHRKRFNNDRYGCNVACLKIIAVEQVSVSNSVLAASGINESICSSHSGHTHTQISIHHSYIKTYELCRKRNQ